MKPQNTGTVVQVIGPVLDIRFENGQLPAQDSRDGVHLYSGPCKEWLEYLKTHTVDYDTLYPDGAPQTATGE